MRSRNARFAEIFRKLTNFDPGTSSIAATSGLPHSRGPSCGCDSCCGSGPIGPD
jgi:hypothetical protein